MGFNNCKNEIMKTKSLRVIGQEVSQIVLEINAILKNPDFHVNNPIIDEKFEINIISKHIFDGKLVVQAKLIKNIIYKAIKNDKSYISHKTVKKSFKLEFDMCDLKREDFLNEFTGKGISDNTEIQLHIKDIQSDTIPGPIYSESDCENDEEKNEEDYEVMFNNPSLISKFNDGLCNINDEKKNKLKQKVNEKVLIKMKAIVSQWVIVDMPFIYPPIKSKKDGGGV